MQTVTKQFQLFRESSYLLVVNFILLHVHVNVSLIILSAAKMYQSACGLKLVTYSLVLDFCFRRFLLYGIYGKQFCMDENNVILSVSSHFPIKNIVKYNFRYFTCINYKDSSISRSCNLMKPLIWDYLTNLEHTLIGVTSNSLFCIHEVFQL